jgi:hypothetical protein
MHGVFWQCYVEIVINFVVGRCGDAVWARKGNVRIQTIEWIGGKIDIARLDKE